MIDSTTCSSSSGPISPDDIAIHLNTYRVVNYFGNTNLNTTGITDIALFNSNPCTVKFISGTELTSSQGPTAFSFEITDPNHTSRVWDADKTYSTSGLTKQPLTVTPSIVSYTAYIDDTAQTLTLNLAPTVLNTPLDPLDTIIAFSNQIDYSIGVGCNGLISGETISTDKIATLTLSPADVGDVCTSNLDVEYKGNDWFKSNNSTSISINVIKHPVDVATIEYKQGNFRTFQPTYPTMTVGSDLEMRVKVSAAQSIYNEIPGGTMHIWMEDDAGIKLDSSMYTIDLVSGITYDSTNKVYLVALADQGNQGHALFTLNFVAAGTDLVLKYRYIGDSLFAETPLANASSAGPLTFE
jgi:hypothetical protein